MRKAHATASLIRIAIIAVVLFAFVAVLEASDSSTVNYATNQSITAFSTCKKVTNGSATGKNVYVPTQSSAEWASFYTNPPSGVTIGSCAVAIPIVTSQANADLCTIAGNPTTPGNYVFTIPAGTVINSNSTSQPAVTTGTCWAPGSTITIINNGAIYGRGGNGGTGGGDSQADPRYASICNGKPGTAGGPAIGLSYPVTINTANGSIFGGGGGGGGGGASLQRAVCMMGSGGGGGQGSVSSSGAGSGGSGYSGSGGDATGPGSGGPQRCSLACAGVGGTGGSWGAAGAAGTRPSLGNWVGGAGGAGGAAIQGNGNTVTWTGGNDATHVKGAVQ